MDFLKKYVLREIKGIYILVDIKENELIEVDKDTFLLIKMLKAGMHNPTSIGNKMGKCTADIEYMIDEIIKTL